MAVGCYILAYLLPFYLHSFAVVLPRGGIAGAWMVLALWKPIMLRNCYVENRMRVGLIQVDGKLPNLPLMQISDDPCENELLEQRENSNGHQLACPPDCKAYHNVTQAAAIAGVTRRTGYNWMDGRRKPNGRRTKRRLQFEAPEYGRAIRHDLLVRSSRADDGVVAALVSSACQDFGFKRAPNIAPIRPPMVEASGIHHRVSRFISRARVCRVMAASISVLMSNGDRGSRDTLFISSSDNAESLHFTQERFKFVTNFRQVESRALSMKPDAIDSLKLALQHPIAYHRVLASVGGSASAGLFLSQCWYLTIRTTDRDMWWSRTQAEWETETGLSRREQETARKKLKARGLLEERKSGVPAKLYFRLNLKILAQLIEQSAKPAHQNCETAIPGWRIARTRMGRSAYSTEE